MLWCDITRYPSQPMNQAPKPAHGTAKRTGIRSANGSTSTFSRNLGVGAGEVNWTRGTNFADRGGGGFSVVNGNLDVNIGGAGQTLVWHGTSGGNEYFLRSGQSLRFGSGQSNGVVTLVNNLALDDGSVGLPFESRQIVTDSLASTLPNPAFRTRITGVISGSASTGLMKSGNAMLELTAANTYAGGTLVDAGALLVSNTSGSATGTGRVVVYGLLLGNGTIAPSSGNGVTIMPSPVSGANGLALYRDQYLGTPGNLTIGSAGTNNPVTLRSTVNALFQLNGTTFDPAGGSTSYSRLTVKGTGAVTVDGSVLTSASTTASRPASRTSSSSWTTRRTTRSRHVQRDRGRCHGERGVREQHSRRHLQDHLLRQLHRQ